MYVTEDKFNKFILTDTIPDEIIKNAKEYSIYLRKDKIHRWYRFILDIFYVRAIDVKNVTIYSSFNHCDVKFVTNQEFINLVRGSMIETKCNYRNVKSKQIDIKNLDIIGHANRFYRGDPELLYFLNLIETRLGIYINKNDIKLRDFKFIFYPKNLLSLEGNGRYEECNIWQYFTTDDFWKS